MFLNKSGQVTVFFILGIVLLVIAGIVFFIITSTQNKKAEEDFIKAISSLNDVSAIEIYISVCLENSLKQSLLSVGKQGGYAVPPEDSYVNFKMLYNEELYVSGFEFESFPYYNSGNIVLIPSRNDVSEELSLITHTHVTSCLFGLENLSENLEISVGEPSVVVSLLDETAVAHMTLSVNLTDREKVSYLNSFSTIVPFSYNATFGVTKLFVESQINNLDYFDFGKAVLLSKQYEFKFSRSLLDGDTSLLGFDFGNFNNMFSDNFKINFAIKHSSVQEMIE